MKMAASSFISTASLKESQMTTQRCRGKPQLWVSAPSVFSAIFPTPPLMALDTCWEPTAGTQRVAGVSWTDRQGDQDSEQNTPTCLARP